MAKRKNAIADAYVNLIPSADGFKDGIKDAINEGTNAGTKMAMPGFSNLAMGFAQGIGQAAFNVVEDIGKKAYEVAKSAIDSYADFEQLSGGIDTLFGTGGKSLSKFMKENEGSEQQLTKQYNDMQEASARMMEYAENAYKTSGLSINEYMETSIQSAAAMINSLGGDQKKAADLMDMSITDMADNVNKMGTTMEAVQNAYRGFSRGNFTMLDNLALGYAGTKEGMEELLAKATEFTGIEYNIESYSDIVKAIHAVQEEMGITGTTALEASTTITGSASAVKAAWENVLTGIANEDADIGKLLDNLFVTIFGDENNNGFLDNLLPRIEAAMSGLTEFMTQIAERLPSVMNELLPMLIETFSNIFNNIINGLVQNSDMIIENLGNVFSILVDKAFELLGSLIESLPIIIEIALKLITTLAYGIAEAIPQLIPTIYGLIETVAIVILDNLPMILDAAVAILMALVEGFSDLDIIGLAIVNIMAKIVATIAEMLPEIVYAALNIAITLITSLVDGILKMLNSDFFMDCINAIVNAFVDIDWVGIADKCLDGLSEGFTRGMDKVVESAKKVGSSIKTAFQEIMKIQSPSKVFREYGEMIDKGLSIGIESGESVTAAAELANNVNDNFIGSISSANADFGSTENGRMVELLAAQNDLLWQILNKNYGRSDAEIFKTVQTGAKEYVRRTGSYAFGR